MSRGGTSDRAVCLPLISLEIDPGNVDVSPSLLDIQINKLMIIAVGNSKTRQIYRGLFSISWSGKPMCVSRFDNSRALLFSLHGVNK